MHTYTEVAILCCIIVAERKLKTWLLAAAGHPKNAFTKGGGRWIRLLVDGNGPLALGNYLLLSNFWVLFCMLIFISWLCSKKWENRKKIRSTGVSKKHHHRRRLVGSGALHVISIFIIQWSQRRVFCLSPEKHFHHHHQNSWSLSWSSWSFSWSSWSSSLCFKLETSSYFLLLLLVGHVVLSHFQTGNKKNTPTQLLDSKQKIQGLFHFFFFWILETKKI